MSAAVAAPTSAVLAIAARLDPDPRGFGTHRQLGLGACPFLALTGFPCPMCGMTTTFALVADLRPLDALVNQPFGVVLFALTAGVSAVAATQAATGRPWAARALERVLRHDRVVASVLLAGLLVGWGWKVVLVRGWLSP
ncbi:MAG: DUF2752 domain-containing protein [Myxococcota bacterium]